MPAAYRTTLPERALTSVHKGQLQTKFKPRFLRQDTGCSVAQGSAWLRPHAR